MNWYNKYKHHKVPFTKEARVGAKYLEVKGVPKQNIPAFMQYLLSLPDPVQNYLTKKFILKNPKMSIDELKSIPVTIEKETEIDPEMEKLVKKVSPKKQEREWLRQLVLSGRFQKEDAVKLKNMLTQFNKLKSDKSINDFNDDIALSKYLSQFENTKTTTKDVENIDGVKLVKSEHEIDVYYVTSQEGLDALGEGANWCVLTKGNLHQPTTYDPFEYYIFLLNDKPEALYHEGTEQFKDSHDDHIGNSPHLVIKLKNIVQELNLRGYEGFNEVAAEVDKIQNHLANNHNQTEIEKLIKDGKVNYIQENLWPTYGQVMLENLNHMKTNSIGYNLLDFLANYADIHGLNKELSILEQQVIDTIMVNPLSIGRMRKLIPDTLRTQRILETNKTNWIEDIQSTYDDLAYLNCPEEYINDPQVYNAIKKQIVKIIFHGGYDLNGEELYIPHYQYQDYIPEPFIQDVDIQDNLAKKVSQKINTWIPFMRQRPWRVKIPDIIEDHPKIQQAKTNVINALASRLKQCPFFINDKEYESIPKEFKDNPTTQRAMLDGFKTQMIKAPSVYVTGLNDYHNTVLPSNIKNHPEIQEIYSDKNVWIPYLQKLPYHYQYCPKELQNDPNILAIYNSENVWHKAVSEYSHNQLPEHLQNNQKIQEKLIEQCIARIKHQHGFDNLMYYKNTFPKNVKTDPRVQAFLLEKMQYEINYHMEYCAKNGNVKAFESFMHRFLGASDLTQYNLKQNWEMDDNLIQILLNYAANSRLTFWKTLLSHQNDLQTYEFGSTTNKEKTLYDILGFYQKCPQDIKELPEIKVIYFESCVNIYLKNNNEYYLKKLPEEVQNDPRIQSTIQNQNQNNQQEIQEIQEINKNL